MPPIDTYRIGDLHFVRDGHHRVSVARAMGLDVIEAYVTQVITAVAADERTRLRDLALKGHERLFFERVPLPADSRSRIQLSDEWRYAELAESVEAWGFRAMQGLGEFMTRDAVAEGWFRDEYAPVVAMLREADLIGSGTKPRPICGSRACATCFCARTNGATRWSSGSGSPCASPQARKTPWSTACARSCAGRDLTGGGRL